MLLLSEDAISSGVLSKKARLGSKFPQLKWRDGTKRNHKDETNILEGRALSHLTFSSYVTLSGDSYYGRFGNKVSLSSDGKRLAVSSRTKDVYYDASVQVFEFDGDKENPSWNMIGNEIQMESSVDSADILVELDGDGNTMITGFSYNVGGKLNYAVKARVFTLMNGQWEQIGSDIGSWTSNGFPSDIGVSIDASGTRIAVAFSLDNEINLYDWVDGQWKLVGQINGMSPFEQLGAALALSSDGKTIAIGAPNYSSKDLDQIGAVRVYRYLGKDWVQLGSSIVGEAAKDRSGASLDISANGNIIMIGAMFNDACRGQVRVYEYDDNLGDWNQLGQDINGEEGEIVNERAGDLSGKSISMSDDGLTIAIGAPNNRKNEDYYYTGHVRVYSFQQQQWVQILDDIDGLTDGDTLGYSLSLSGSGHQLAIGAPGNADANVRAGQVRVYEADIPVTSSPTDSPTRPPFVSPTLAPSINPTAPIIELRNVQITYTLGFKNRLDGVPYSAATLKDRNIHSDVMDAIKASLFSALTASVSSDVDTSNVPSYTRNLSSQVFFELKSPTTSILHNSIIDLSPCPRNFIESDSCVKVITDIIVLFNSIKYKSDEVQSSVIKILESTMPSSEFVDSLNTSDVTRLEFGETVEIRNKDGIGTNTIIIIASSSLVGIGAILCGVRLIRRPTSSERNKHSSPKKKDDDIDFEIPDSAYDFYVTRKIDPSVVSGLTTNFASKDLLSSQSRPKLRLPETLKEVDEDFSDDGHSYDVSYIPSESKRSTLSHGDNLSRPFSAADSIASIVSYASDLVLPLKKKLREIEEKYSSGHRSAEGMNANDSDRFLSLSNFFGLERNLPERTRDPDFHFNMPRSIDDDKSENNSFGSKRLS